jgi:hypothetical protein
VPVIRRRVPPLILVALGGLLSFGCTRWLPGGAGSDAAAPAASVLDAGPALTAVWSDRELSVAELPSAHARFDLDEASYEMRFKGFPVGTTVVVDGRASSMAGDYTERVDVATPLSLLSPAAALDDDLPLDPHTDFELRVPGYAPLQIAAPRCRASREVGQMMAKAVNHPVLFPREVSTDPPLTHHTILFVAKYSRRDDVFGPQRRCVKSTGSQSPRPSRHVRGGTCAIPSESGHGPPTYVRLQLVDEEVTVVERKTARLIDKRTSPATTHCQCPSYAFQGVAETSPDDAEMKRWLREQRLRP